MINVIDPKNEFINNDDPFVMRESSVEYDYLTGLYNRYFFKQAYEVLDLEEHIPFGVVICDINGLKTINEMYGSCYGDQLLMKLAYVIKQVSLPERKLSRWGSDEFLLLISGGELKKVLSIVNDINSINLVTSFDQSNKFISVGYSIINDSKDSVEAHIKAAENMMLNEKLLLPKSSRSILVNSMKHILQVKNEETESHTSRLPDCCLEMGKRLNLSSVELNDLSLVATLHDIGKIAINSTILEKNGVLNNEEWIDMKQHSEFGYRILKSIPELEHIAESVLYHHERWDGKGYPNGLKENEIPLLSRIISIVDAYDAMTNDRVYKKAMSVNDAKIELLQNAGSQFDPNLVKVFLDAIK